MENEILLDSNISEEEFKRIIKSYYPGEFYIYSEVPEYQEDFFLEMDGRFEIIKIIKSSGEIDKTSVVFVENFSKSLVFSFFERASNLEIIFSNVKNKLCDFVYKTMDIYTFFESRRINHITIGPDNLCLNVYQY